MRQITLSDHPNDKAALAARERELEYDRAIGKYLKILEEREQKARSLRNQQRKYFREGRVLRWLGAGFGRVFHAMSASPVKPKMAAAGRDEIIWNIGAEGEARVAETLSRMFNDDWLLVSGYKNRGGEIDQILIGPPGVVVAMEIKYLNGVVSCVGDQWQRDKYDRYGNCVEVGVPKRDRKNRGPSAQLNQSANLLEKFLQRRIGFDCSGLIAPDTSVKG